MIGGEIFRSIETGDFAAYCHACHRLSPTTANGLDAVAAWEHHVRSGNCKGLTPAEHDRLPEPPT